MIELKNVSYSYASAEGEHAAVEDVTAKIPAGITAVIGRTGSGKTTLMELIGGLLRPDKGSIKRNGTDISELKGEIGIVFQYPEYQLFADTVYDDIAFGPKNAGIDGAELKKRVTYAAELTGISGRMLDMSPFELSGGQKRLAAAAGVLAMKPSLLLLDEPAAGLDPASKKRLFGIIRSLAESDAEMTVVFVTHSMEDAAEYADNIIVMKDGRAVRCGTPRQVFSHTCGAAELPAMARLAAELKRRGADAGSFCTVDEAFEAVLSLLGGRRGNA